jgi:hypothetical protein
MANPGRNCKFCGERGHNIRSCNSAASARNLISKFGDIVRNEIPTVAGKIFPLSGFEGSLVSMNFKIADNPFHCSENNNFTDGLSYYRRKSINDAIENVLKETSTENRYSDRVIICKMLAPVFETNNLQLGFFVEKDSFSTSWNKRAEMSLIAEEIDFKISDYIQDKMHEPGGNRYKTLWRKICEHTNLTEKYRGWEGKEGEMIRAFLEEAVKELQTSANNKRTDPNKMFSVISSRLGRTERTYSAESRCGVVGEWMHLDPPQISFTWREKPDDWEFSFELTDKLKEKIEEAVKQPFLNELFVEAQNYIYERVSPIRYYRNDRDETSISLNTLYKLVNERSFEFTADLHHERGYFESLEVDDDFFFNEEPPPIVVSEWEKACKTGASSADYTVKDFIKMAHSGGYAQSYDKGLMQARKFPGMYPAVSIEEKNDYDGKYYNVRWVGRDYVAARDAENFSLSEIVLAAMEALVYSERVIK